MKHLQAWAARAYLRWEVPAGGRWWWVDTATVCMYVSALLVLDMGFNFLRKWPLHGHRFARLAEVVGDEPTIIFLSSYGALMCGIGGLVSALAFVRAVAGQQRSTLQGLAWVVGGAFWVIGAQQLASLLLIDTGFYYRWSILKAFAGLYMTWLAVESVLSVRVLRVAINAESPRVLQDIRDEFRALQKGPTS